MGESGGLLHNSPCHSQISVQFSILCVCGLHDTLLRAPLFVLWEQAATSTAAAQAEDVKEQRRLLADSTLCVADIIAVGAR